MAERSKKRGAWGNLPKELAMYLIILGAAIYAALALLWLLFCAWVASLGDFWD
jgi:hypothetical protein